MDGQALRLGRSRSSPGCSSILIASLLLGFLFAVCFPPCYVPGFDLQREFPQGLLGQVVAKVVEEVYDVVISPDFIVPGGKGAVSESRASQIAGPEPGVQPRSLWALPINRLVGSLLPNP